MLFALASLGATAQSAYADDSHKTLTVSQNGDGDYTTIQAAINYVAAQANKAGWTITVEDGTYSRFVVLDGLDNLTVKAANQGGATVDVLDGKTPEDVKFGGGYLDACGIIVWNADGVTIDGFVINSTQAMSSPWYAASLSTHSEASEKANDLTVRNCTFTGTGKYGLFISSGTSTVNVAGNTFESGISEAIEFMCDNSIAGGSAITGNTFDGNSFAIHGYWGGTPGEGGNPSLTVSGNTLKGQGAGATDRRCKIILEDQLSSGSVTPSVTGNTINNGVVGLVNVGNTNAAAVISGNTLSGGSFAVDAKEPGTIDLYSNYQVFQADYNFGYWALTNIDNDNKLDVSWGKNPGDAVEFVQAAIDEANAKHSNVLSIDADMNGNLISTFTWFKDAVYWVPYANGSLTVSKSDESIVKAGEEFTFQIELTGEGISGTQVFYDGDAADGTHANETTFTDGKAQVTLAKGESVTLEGIPAGTAYSVTETGADGYETNPSGKVASGTIDENETAVASFTNAKRVDIAVTKVWDDGDDADGIRPESVTVDLLANGEATGDAIELTAEDDWAASFDALPAYDADGAEVEYSVAEEPVDGYDSEVSGSVAEGFTVTNVHEPEGEDPDDPGSADDDDDSDDGEDADDDSGAAPAKTGTPQTGDAAPVAPAVAVLAAALCAAFLAVVRRHQADAARIGAARHVLR